jgi:hypothetical protein
MYDFKGLLVPLIVILLKKNEDYFRCFSKLDDMAHTSIFQKTIVQLDATYNKNNFLSVKSIK